jgi:predicted nicotinamide N-methyase
MGNSKSKEQSEFDKLIVSGRENLPLCAARTDTIFLNVPYSKNPDNFKSLQFKHYLTFPNLYEGLKLWEGAVLLLRHILKLENRHPFEGKKVMDLGAGMGVIGITLAKLLECKVTMTDYIPEVLKLCQENTQLNFQETEDGVQVPKTEHLDWNSFEESNCVKNGEKFDIIIGCELVYAVTQCDNLIKLIKRILKPQGKLVMIIPTCRTNREEFMQKMEELGDFEITECILNDPEDKMSPLVTKKEDELEKDIFYPLKSLEFRYLEIKLK